MRLRDPRRLPLNLLSTPGDVLTLDIGPVAHGGHCVARIGSGPNAGRVVFVRHALPGEKVRARITEHGKVWRADALEVLENLSPYRVPSAWPEAGPGGVGGGELSHVSPEGQRRWKAAVIAEQITRLAKIDISRISPTLAIDPKTFELTELDSQRGLRDPATPVGAAAPTSAQDDGGGVGAGAPTSAQDDGGGVGAGAPTSAQDDGGEVCGALGVESLSGGATGTRTRVELVTNEQGQAGMTKHRSGEIIPLKSMPLATPELGEFLENKGVWRGGWPANARLTAVVPAGSKAADGILLVNQDRNSTPAPMDTKFIKEIVQLDDKSYEYQVAADGFWQVHEKAPAWLIENVLKAANLKSGQKVLDLYAGSGLFTVPLAEAVGTAGQVIAIEGDKKAAENAKTNTAQFSQVEVIQADVRKALAKPSTRTTANNSASKNRKATPATNLGANQNSINTEKTDVVILDPPRVGAGQQVVTQIAARNPERVVYVACDPAALARDIAYFQAANYHLTDLKAADLFPNTHHVECVAVLTRD